MDGQYEKEDVVRLGKDHSYEEDPNITADSTHKYGNLHLAESGRGLGPA